MTEPFPGLEAFMCIKEDSSKCFCLFLERNVFSFNERQEWTFICAAMLTHSRACSINLSWRNCTARRTTKTISFLFPRHFGVLFICFYAFRLVSFCALSVLARLLCNFYFAARQSRHENNLAKKGLAQ